MFRAMCWRDIKRTPDEEASITIYMMDSALSCSSGHHDHFARGWRQCSNALGEETVLLGPKNVSGDLRRELNVAPVFSRSLYDQACSGFLEDFSVGSAVVAKDLEASGLRPKYGDLIFLPTATPRELAGICKWISTFSQCDETWSTIAAIFHWGTAESLRADTQSADLFRAAADLVDAARPRLCWLGATHNSLREGLGTIFRRPVHLVPSMSFFPRPCNVSKPQSHPTSHPLLAFLGGARLAKGIAIIPHFLQLAADEELPARLIIQCHGMAAGNRRLDRFRSRSVIVIDRWLPPDQFNALLMSAAAVVLPYDEGTYRSMVSGVFTMATAMSKPCIVPSGTWMSERILEGDAAGVIYEPGGASSLMGAVKQFLSNIDHLTALAEELKAAWRRKYSAETVVQTILNLHLEARERII
jgi:hypothetical protein